jgi:hypothetical protein
MKNAETEPLDFQQRQGWRARGRTIFQQVVPPMLCSVMLGLAFLISPRPVGSLLKSEIEFAGERLDDQGSKKALPLPDLLIL